MDRGTKVLKTLIVEDNRFNRDTLKELFRRHFPAMVVEEASSGGEATQKVESFAPDLILMDIRLPDISGLELTRKIKITNPDAKVLILTGHHYPEYKEAAERYGADGFLVKGGSSKEILAIVESFFPKAKEGLTIK
jgi:DNA-binding NarL/FixJ family response regulator